MKYDEMVFAMRQETHVRQANLKIRNKVNFFDSKIM